MGCWRLYVFLAHHDMKNSNTDYYLPRPENFIEWLYAIYNMVTSRYVKETKSCFEEIQNISHTVRDLMIHQNFSNYYGECPICRGDMWDTNSKFTQCDHIFHEVCLNQWLNGSGNDCPLCRAVLIKKNVANRRTHPISLTTVAHYSLFSVFFSSSRFACNSYVKQACIFSLSAFACTESLFFFFLRYVYLKLLVIHGIRLSLEWPFDIVHCCWFSFK